MGRIVALACVLALVPGAVSFARTVLQPSNAGFSIRAVEWMRDHGSRSFVSTIENAY